MPDLVTVTAEVLLTEANATTTAMLGDAYTYVIPLAERIATDTYPLLTLIGL